MFDLLHTYNIPIMVFSAGLGNVIEEVIRQQANIYTNMKVVSNFMNFDSQVHCELY